MVEGDRLEICCAETHLGFESLTLRHEKMKSFERTTFYFVAGQRVRDSNPSYACDKNQAFIAHLNLAERARLLILHSSDDGRMGYGAISL